MKLKDWLTQPELNQVNHDNHDEWLAVAAARAGEPVPVEPEDDEPEEINEPTLFDGQDDDQD